MKDSTLIRIKVPKALYESAFKKALLEAAEKAKTKKRLKEEPIQEDMAMAGNIALGVVGGLAGLWAGVGVTKFLAAVAGSGLEALANKLESSAKRAARGRRKEFIAGIVKKFDGDTQLQSMYAALPPYSPKTKNERNKQMRKIAEYIKSKLSSEEMDYFNDISSMLRTGDLAMKENKRLKEAISGTEEELKAFYEKVKQIEAEGTDIDSAIQYALFDMTNPTAAAELSNDQLAEASAKTSKEEKKQADAKKEKAAKAKKAEAEKKAEADKKAKKAETEKKPKKPKTIDEALQGLMAKGKK